MSAIVIFIIVVFIFILLAILLWGRFVIDESQYGTWQQLSIGPCNGTTQETVSGCIPNVQTRRGCLTDDGQQTFRNMITNNACVPSVQISAWQDTTGPCLLYTTNNILVPATQCKDNTMKGITDVTKLCVAKDSSGPNNCTQNVIKDGATVTLSFDIGQSIVVKHSCSNYVNASCGLWQFVSPSTVGTRVLTPSDIVAPCIFNAAYVNTPTCIATGILSEGFTTIQMGCIVQPNVTIPAAGDPTLQICGVIPCSNVVISPDMPVPNNAVICGNNPSCLSGCRLFPGTATGTPLDILINMYIILSSSNNVLTAWNEPRNNTSAVRFAPPVPVIGSGVLGSVPLTLTQEVHTGCTSTEVMFNTGIILLISPLGGSQCNILALVNSNILGWLDHDSNNTLLWTQAQQYYNGPGTIKQDATIFNITYNAPLLTLRDSNNNQLFVTDDNANIINMDNMNATLYNYTTDITSRNISPCNILLAL